MKKISLWLLVILWLLRSQDAQAQTNIQANEKDLLFLQTFRADYVKSKLEKRTEVLRAYLADTIRLMTEFQRTVFGKKNVISYHQAFAERFDVNTYTRDALEVLDLGQMIVEHGQFTMSIRSKLTGQVHLLKGKYQNIWKKQASGNLLLTTEGWNYDHPVEIGDQMRFAEVPVVDIALQPHLPIDTPIRFELAALSRLQESAISQHDANLWAQFYSDDAIFFSQRLPFQQGRKAIDDYIEKHVSEMPIFEKLDIRNDRIEDLGIYVIEYASHVACWRNGNSSGIGLGKDLRIWRREKNGSLKIFRHIGMYD